MEIPKVIVRNPVAESGSYPDSASGVSHTENGTRAQKTVQGQDSQRGDAIGKSVNKRKIGDNSLNKAVDQLNAVLASMDRYLKFSVDKPSGRTVVKIVDSKNNKVIKQIPPDAILTLSAKIRELIGILFDKWS